MSAIGTLTTIASNYFAGHAHLAYGGTGGLAAIINTITNKINMALASINAGSFDTLAIGDATGYYAIGNYWFICDGVNPPTLAMLRMQDQVTGVFYDLTLQSGVWTVTPA